MVIGVSGIVNEIPSQAVVDTHYSFAETATWINEASLSRRCSHSSIADEKWTEASSELRRRASPSEDGPPDVIFRILTMLGSAPSIAARLCKRYATIRTPLETDVSNLRELACIMPLFRLVTSAVAAASCAFVMASTFFFSFSTSLDETTTKERDESRGCWWIGAQGTAIVRRLMVFWFVNGGNFIYFQCFISAS